MNSRDVHDIIHKVAAVGSRSVEKAQEFIDTVAGGNKLTKAYGSYEEVYADKVREAPKGNFTELTPYKGRECNLHRYVAKTGS